MTLVLVIGLAAVVSILVIGATRRALVDERQSVRHHQQALETLRHIGDRNTPPRANGGRATRGASEARTERAVAYSSTPARRTTKLASSAPPRTRAPRSAPPDAGSPGKGGTGTDDDAGMLVFDDASAAGTRLSGAGSAERVTDDQPTRAVPVFARVPTSRSARLSLGAALAAGVVVVGAVVGALVLTSSRHHHPTVTAHKPPTSAPVHNIPVDAVFAPVQSSASAATYRVPTGPYVVQLDATGSCWVYATDATGHVVWTGTLAAGQTRALPANGQLVVKLGSAGFTMSVGGRQVQLPKPMQAPFQATFATS